MAGRVTYILPKETCSALEIRTNEFWLIGESLSDMNIENQKQGHVLIAKIKEHRFDARVAEEIVENITESVNNGENSIVINLSEVDYIDSRGLAAIVSSYKKVTQRGQMVLSGTHKPVLDMFKLARMDKVFRIYKDDEEAVAALSREVL